MERYSQLVQFFNSSDKTFSELYPYSPYSSEFHLKDCSVPADSADPSASASESEDEVSKSNFSQFSSGNELPRLALLDKPPSRLQLKRRPKKTEPAVEEGKASKGEDRPRDAKQNAKPRCASAEPRGGSRQEHTQVLGRVSSSEIPPRPPSRRRENSATGGARSPDKEGEHKMKRGPAPSSNARNKPPSTSGERSSTDREDTSNRNKILEWSSKTGRDQRTNERETRGQSGFKRENHSPRSSYSRHDTDGSPKRGSSQGSHGSSLDRVGSGRASLDHKSSERSDLSCGTSNACRSSDRSRPKSDRSLSGSDRSRSGGDIAWRGRDRQKDRNIDAQSRGKGTRQHDANDGLSRSQGRKTSVDRGASTDRNFLTRSTDGKRTAENKRGSQSAEITSSQNCDNRSNTNKICTAKDSQNQGNNPKITPRTFDHIRSSQNQGDSVKSNQDRLKSAQGRETREQEPNNRRMQRESADRLIKEYDRRRRNVEKAGGERGIHAEDRFYPETPRSRLEKSTSSLERGRAKSVRGSTDRSSPVLQTRAPSNERNRRDVSRKRRRSPEREEEEAKCIAETRDRCQADAERGKKNSENRHQDLSADRTFITSKDPNLDSPTAKTENARELNPETPRWSSNKNQKYQGNDSANRRYNLSADRTFITSQDPNLDSPTRKTDNARELNTESPLWSSNKNQKYLGNDSANTHLPKPSSRERPREQHSESTNSNQKESHIKTTEYVNTCLQQQHEGCSSSRRDVFKDEPRVTYASPNRQTESDLKALVVERSEAHAGPSHVRERKFRTNNFTLTNTLTSSPTFIDDRDINSSPTRSIDFGQSDKKEAENFPLLCAATTSLTSGRPEDLRDHTSFHLPLPPTIKSSYEPQHRSSHSSGSSQYSTATFSPVPSVQRKEYTTSLPHSERETRTTGDKLQTKNVFSTFADGQQSLSFSEKESSKRDETILKKNKDDNLSSETETLLTRCFVNNSVAKSNLNVYNALQKTYGNKNLAEYFKLCVESQDMAQSTMSSKKSPPLLLQNDSNKMDLPQGNGANVAKTWQSSSGSDVTEGDSLFDIEKFKQAVRSVEVPPELLDPLEESAESENLLNVLETISESPLEDCSELQNSRSVEDARESADESIHASATSSRPTSRGRPIHENSASDVSDIQLHYAYGRNQHDQLELQWIKLEKGIDTTSETSDGSLIESPFRRNSNSSDVHVRSVNLPNASTAQRHGDADRGPIATYLSLPTQSPPSCEDPDLAIIVLHEENLTEHQKDVFSRFRLGMSRNRSRSPRANGTPSDKATSPTRDGSALIIPIADTKSGHGSTAGFAVIADSEREAPLSVDVDVKSWLGTQGLGGENPPILVNRTISKATNVFSSVTQSDSRIDRECNQHGSITEREQSPTSSIRDRISEIKQSLTECKGLFQRGDSPPYLVGKSDPERTIPNNTRPKTAPIRSTSDQHDKPSNSNRKTKQHLPDNAKKSHQSEASSKKETANTTYLNTEEKTNTRERLSNSAKGSKSKNSDTVEVLFETKSKKMWALKESLLNTKRFNKPTNQHEENRVTSPRNNPDSAFNRSHIPKDRTLLSAKPNERPKTAPVESKLESHRRNIKENPYKRTGASALATPEDETPAIEIRRVGSTTSITSQRATSSRTPQKPPTSGIPLKRVVQDSPAGGEMTGGVVQVPACEADSCESSASSDSGVQRYRLKRNIAYLSEYRKTIDSLRAKCVMKDHMIDALLDELQLLSPTEETYQRLMVKLTSRKDNGPPPRRDYTCLEVADILLPRGGGERRGEAAAEAGERRGAAKCVCPSDFRVVGKVGCDCLLLTWKSAQDIDTVTGYQVHVDGQLSQHVRSPTRTSALLMDLDLSREMRFSLRTLRARGLAPCHAPLEIAFQPAADAWALDDAPAPGPHAPRDP